MRQFLIVVAVLLVASVATAQETGSEQTTARRQLDRLRNNGLDVPGLGRLKGTERVDRYVDQNGSPYTSKASLDASDFGKTFSFTDEENEFSEALNKHGRSIKVHPLARGLNGYLVSTLFDDTNISDEVWRSIEFPSDVLHENYRPLFWSIVRKSYVKRTIEAAYWAHVDQPQYEKGLKFFKNSKRPGRTAAEFRKTMDILSLKVGK